MVHTKEYALALTVKHDDFKQLPKPVFYFSKVGGKNNTKFISI